MKKAETDLLKDPLVREEIGRYQWIESEKAGFDIGWQRASEEWVSRYAIAWCRAHPIRKRPFRREDVRLKKGSCSESRRTSNFLEYSFV
ncbi:MAG: hypothetical protein HQL21_03630 [Candidatus Omnitrophica bacterium]|nr:hypothetical protein [Candidatus Omnitrophota bacterium]